MAGRDDPELTGLKAELDARAAREAIDERTGKELLLRLRERSSSEISPARTSRGQPSSRRTWRTFGRRWPS